MKRHRHMHTEIPAHACMHTDTQLMHIHIHMNIQSHTHMGTHTHGCPACAPWSLGAFAHACLCTALAAELPAQPACPLSPLGGAPRGQPSPDSDQGTIPGPGQGSWGPPGRRAAAPRGHPGPVQAVDEAAGPTPACEQK